MNWPRIESIVYSEENHPEDLLGVHKTGAGSLIQTFQPNADTIFLFDEDEKIEYRMEMMDEEGYFALLLPGKTLKNYKYFMIDKEKKETEFFDPYQFVKTIKEEEINKFKNGTQFQTGELFGSKVTTENNVKGTRFTVWAPDAQRVSVIGDFNQWDGRIHQMMEVRDSGIYTLFIPEVGASMYYQYEIKTKHHELLIKADPYENEHETRPGQKSVICEKNNFLWEDESFIENRRLYCDEEKPMNVLEYNFSNSKNFEGKFLNYREIGKQLIPYVLQMSYTHVNLMGIMEYPMDESLGFQPIGFYAPTSRYGKPEDLKYLINELHKAKISVLMDFSTSGFPKDSYGLNRFSGECLYEYGDERKGERKDIGINIFDFGRNEVCNYLLGSAEYFIREFHFDGLRINDLDSVLYYDNDSMAEHAVNIYGSNENLEGIKFIQKLNTDLHKKYQGIMMVCEEQRGYPLVTEKTDKEGLGFDYKWNNGYINDLQHYLRFDPYFRRHHHEELTLSMIYFYCEKFMLPVSYELCEKNSLIKSMPGNEAEQEANVRAMLGYSIMHPGKKLFFTRNIDQAAENSKEYQKDLNAFYLAHSALYEKDFSTEGFQWVENVNANYNILSFLRQSETETLFVIAHFANVIRKGFTVTVPFEGKYKEIFNSDHEQYGGNGLTNIRMKTSVKDKMDESKNTLKIDLAPLSILVFLVKKQEDMEKSDLKTNSKKAVTKKDNLAKKLSREYDKAQEKIALGSEIRRNKAKGDQDV